MTLLLLFAFIAGIVTILSPCILPLLPIILSTSIENKDINKFKPLGIILGFIVSFTFFTLFLSSIVNATNIPSESLRYFAILVLLVFGFTQLLPQTQNFLENLFSKLANFSPNTTSKQGIWGGIIIGLSLGLLWTPCVGPILASVISLALSGKVTFNAFLITLAYSIGTAIPMFAIMLGGRNLLNKFPKLTANTSQIQKLFGVIMIATSVALFFNVDRKFQTIILNIFPNYGAGLTNFEDTEFIKEKLEDINNKSQEDLTYGKPLNELLPNKGPLAPEILPGGEWINSENLTLSQLRGKVVLLDFWTYTCINCQRTFPYLRTWFEKYKDQGLVIIGVHSPEFEFEKDIKNVIQATKDFDLTYPIVQDNNFSTWRAYNNRYWPAKYLIDKDGFIRYTHFGEGEYNKTENMIQTLLNEIENNNVSKEISNADYKIYSKTPELYLGYLRMQNLISPEKIIKDKTQTYSKPNVILNNSFAFEGNVLVSGEYSNPQKGSKLYLNFESQEVFLVIRSKSNSSTIKILLDDKEENLGEDVNLGVVTVSEDKLYKLIKLPFPGRHILKLEFLDDDSEIFAFTFG